MCQEPTKRGCLPGGGYFEAKRRVASFEENLDDWKAGILPLNYSRDFRGYFKPRKRSLSKVVWLKR